jgi:tetratricopeptide (TPR) repeat protein
MTDADRAMARGNAAFEAGDLAAALAAYEQAVAALTPADDPLAGDLYENLGIVYWQLGRWAPASRALLRALDGDLGAREQSLRLLVSCRFRDGAVVDGERLLGEYTRRFGPHPERWTRG